MLFIIIVKAVCIRGCPSVRRALFHFLVVAQYRLISPQNTQTIASWLGPFISSAKGMHLLLFVILCKQTQISCDQEIDVRHAARIRSNWDHSMAYCARTLWLQWEPWFQNHGECAACTCGWRWQPFALAKGCISRVLGSRTDGAPCQLQLQLSPMKIVRIQSCPDASATTRVCAPRFLKPWLAAKQGMEMGPQADARNCSPPASAACCWWKTFSRRWTGHALMNGSK